MAMNEVKIDPAGTKDTGICECCGHRSRRVWGYAHVDDRCVAAYFVHWTLGHIADRGANIDLILGDWGEAADPGERNAVALAYRLLETGWEMMVIDSEGRDFTQSDLVGQAMNRHEVLGTALADDAFAVADAILAQDVRVAELLGEPDLHS